MSNFDPSTKVEGFKYTYGDITRGGNCWGGMPAVFMESKEIVYLGSDDDGHPQTEELYEKYGARLPNPYEIDVIADIEIGCENYQALVAAGVAVDACTSCPLLRTIQ